MYVFSVIDGMLSIYLPILKSSFISSGGFLAKWYCKNARYILKTEVLWKLRLTKVFYWLCSHGLFKVWRAILWEIPNQLVCFHSGGDANPDVSPWLLQTFHILSVWKILTVEFWIVWRDMSYTIGGSLPYRPNFLTGIVIV